MLLAVQCTACSHCVPALLTGLWRWWRGGEKEEEETGAWGFHRWAVWAHHRTPGRHRPGESAGRRGCWRSWRDQSARYHYTPNYWSYVCCEVLLIDSLISNSIVGCVFVLCPVADYLRQRNRDGGYSDVTGPKPSKPQSTKHKKEEKKEESEESIEELLKKCEKSQPSELNNGLEGCCSAPLPADLELF